jgi:hypothetical protein
MQATEYEKHSTIYAHYPLLKTPHVTTPLQQGLTQSKSEYKQLSTGPNLSKSHHRKHKSWKSDARASDYNCCLFCFGHPLWRQLVIRAALRCDLSCVSMNVRPPWSSSTLPVCLPTFDLTLPPPAPPATRLPPVAEAAPPSPHRTTTPPPATGLPPPPTSSTAVGGNPPTPNPNSIMGHHHHHRH